MVTLLVLPVVAGGVVGELAAARWRRGARRRFGRCLPSEVPTPGRRRGGRTAARMRRLASSSWAVPLAVGLGATAAVGGWAGVPAGALVALAAQRWLPRTRSPAQRQAQRDRDRLERQLPLTADLLAACLGSVPSPAVAAAAVAQSVGSPMRERLAAVAAQLSLGAAPEACWEGLAEGCPPLAPLARCLVRTSLGGAPPSAALTGLGHAQRATASRAAHARVRRAGVLATAPLGLCFLPAFVLIGVVPVVVGLTAQFAVRI
ncbi:type II secretion system F family protein [Kitasatospora camelliae]|uniref:Type II secretion system F family protein n=1 Tax=Kitasatospora camelliae TaxID=3156397 RepID=A0AAU8JYQ0_9ACTN